MRFAKHSRALQQDARAAAFVWHGGGKQAVRLVAFSMLFAALWAPAQGRAWTETRVTAASAEVTLSPDGGVKGVLRAELRVLGGYLSRFELAGLSPEVELEPSEPPTLEPVDEGAPLYPQATVRRGGRVILDFGGRRHAPTRGRYLLTLPFVARSVPLNGAADSGFARQRLMLPSWEINLEDVVVTVDAPAGSRLAREGWLLSAQTQRTSSGTKIMVRRDQLPRTTAMDVLIDVPVRAAQASAGSRASIASVAARDFNPRGFGASHLSLVVALLALLKLVVVTRRARREGQLSRFLVMGISPAWRASLMACVNAAAWWWPSAQSWAVAAALCALLVLERRSLEGQRMAGRYWTRAASGAELATLRWRALCERFDAAAMLDITTLAGLVTFCCIALLALTIARHQGTHEVLPFFLCTALLFTSGTRRFQPWSLAEKASRLLIAQRTLAAMGGRLVACTDRRLSPARELRLELRLSSSAPGLVELSIVAGEREVYGQAVSALCWLVIVNAESDAHSRILDALPQSRGRMHAASGTLSFVAPVRDLQREAQALRRWLIVTKDNLAHAA